MKLTADKRGAEGALGKGAGGNPPRSSNGRALDKHGDSDWGGVERVGVAIELGSSWSWNYVPSREKLGFAQCLGKASSHNDRATHFHFHFRSGLVCLLPIVESLNRACLNSPR